MASKKRGIVTQLETSLSPNRDRAFVLEESEYQKALNLVNELLEITNEPDLLEALSFLKMELDLVTPDSRKSVLNQVKLIEKKIQVLGEGFPLAVRDLALQKLRHYAKRSRRIRVFLAEHEEEINRLERLLTDDHIAVERQLFSAIRRFTRASNYEMMVYLPNVIESEDDEKVQRLKEALLQLNRVSQHVLDEDKDVIEEYGSWSFKGWFKREVTKEAADLYGMGKEAAGAAAGKIGAENMLVRAKAISEVMSALEPIDEAIFVVHDVVVAKATVDGRSRVVCVTISETLAREMENDPTLLTNPLKFISFTQGDERSASRLLNQRAGP